MASARPADEIDWQLVERRAAKLREAAADQQSGYTLSVAESLVEQLSE